MRTHLAESESEETWPAWPACKKPGFSSSVDRPRAISKSWLKSGCLGTRARAEAISCCSSEDGEQTFSTLTLTCGGCVCCADVSSAHARATKVPRMLRI